jgi:hypothetical protein
MSPNAPHLIKIGVVHHQAGRLHQAESIDQSILKEQPEHPDALHLLISTIAFDYPNCRDQHEA